MEKEKQKRIKSNSLNEAIKLLPHNLQDEYELILSDSILIKRCVESALSGRSNMVYAKLSEIKSSQSISRIKSAYFHLRKYKYVDCEKYSKGSAMDNLILQFKKIYDS